MAINVLEITVIANSGGILGRSGNPSFFSADDLVVFSIIDLSFLP